MRTTSRHRRTPSATGILTVLSLSLLAGGAPAATFTTLHAFAGADGFNSQSPLISDKNGNLFGTTASGGGSNRGVVFELSPPAAAGGAWTYAVIHSFGGKDDGADILGGLAISSAGVLYGTSYEGGTNDQGTVFSLTPPRTAGGAWIEAVLFSFGASHYTGYWPAAGLVIGANGALYGATSYGGANQAGLVFALTPGTPGQPWNETVIYNFQSYGSGDGYSPQAALIADGNGNLYGTTISGGVNGSGAAFELTPAAGGGYNESVLYSFGAQSSDGTLPHGPLLLGKGGVLFGTTSQGGAAGAGTVFELIPGANAWTEAQLYSFSNNAIDGVGPQGPVAIDTLGRLYGVTPFGGNKTFGALYRLTPKTTGPWTEAILRNFTASTDGSNPYGLYMAPNGTVYGTTYAGGDPKDGRWGYGIVYEYSP